MKQFFSKLFKSSRKVNFLGIPESEFISDADEIKSSVNRLIDEMVEFNKKQRIAVKDTFRMNDREYRKQWQFPRMARIELSNFILLPEDFPAVLEYLGFPVSKSENHEGKFYQLPDLYSALKYRFAIDIYTYVDTPYIVYTNNSICVLMSACGYVILICEMDTLKKSFTVVDCNNPGLAYDALSNIFGPEVPKNQFYFCYNSRGGNPLKRNVHQYIEGINVSITPKSINFRLLRVVLQYKNINFPANQYFIELFADKLSQQELTINVKKLHMDYLRNLEEIYRIYGKSGSYNARIPGSDFEEGEYVGRIGFEPETYSGTIKVLLPFEILYRSVNEIPHMKTLL